MKLDLEKTKTVDLNDYVFHYIEEGDGAPIVFVHGSIDDLRSWENQIGTFKEKFRVITYSRRYHCPNATSSTAAYSVEQHSDDHKI